MKKSLFRQSDYLKAGLFVTNDEYYCSAVLVLLTQTDFSMYNLSIRKKRG